MSDTKKDALERLKKVYEESGFGSEFLEAFEEELQKAGILNRPSAKGGQRDGKRKRRTGLFSFLRGPDDEPNVRGDEETNADP
jgi:hypothetical protein